ncbi:hypothetical protein Leryth_005687 [Lithospermum erythrorhizon]|nr:hypothetical protein Leryth_005687 [Lithospermum erythrorhizon]
MSDNESITSQVDSFHSPLPSPINSKAIVTVDKYFTPHRSPHNPSSEHLSFPPTPVVTPPPSVKKGGEVVYNYSRGGGEEGS